MNNREGTIILSAILVLATVVVLKTVPLRDVTYVWEIGYITVPPSFSQSFRIQPHKGFKVSCTFSEENGNELEIYVCKPHFFIGKPSAFIIVEKIGMSSGSCSFTAYGGEYIVVVYNPASEGFFGFGEGPTIKVDVDISEKGKVTYL